MPRLKELRQPRLAAHEGGTQSSLNATNALAGLLSRTPAKRRRMLVEALAELLCESIRDGWIETVSEVLNSAEDEGADSAELAHILTTEFREANWRGVCREVAACVLDETLVYPGRNNFSER